MSLIKKAKLEIANVISSQNLPSEILQLILEDFVKQIEIGNLMTEIKNLQKTNESLQKKQKTEEEVEKNDTNESDDDE